MLLVSARTNSIVSVCLHLGQISVNPNSNFLGLIKVTPISTQITVRKPQVGQIQNEGKPCPQQMLVDLFHPNQR
jgi:hypothetical protein